MKTMAVLADFAIDAPDEGSSVVEVVIVMPLFAARALIASSGAERY
jgi:hypothetical protein